MRLKKCYNTLMFKRVLIIITCLVIFLVIYDAVFHNKPTQMLVVLGGKTFVMDIADTPVVQEQGLSGRKSLPDDGGMIFVFAQPDNYGFWMKDMNFPLDIVWLSPDLKIVHVEKSLATSTYPTIFYPNALSSYVLEISAGQSDKLNIKIGDTVELHEK